MPTKNDSSLVLAGIESIKVLVVQTLTEMKADFNEKHAENVQKRHDLRGRLDEVGNRVTLTEATLRTIVGDSGESGLLHELRRSQERLGEGLTDAREEFRKGLSNVSSDLREIRTTTASAPATRDWMNKWLGVGAAVAIIVSVVGGIASFIAIMHTVAAVSSKLPH